MWLQATIECRAHQALDDGIPAIVRRAIPEIAKLVDSIVANVNQGGRLIYLGAGTSGRLGVLDASECPPTFHCDPDQVIGIIAGGDGALRKSVPQYAVDSLKGLKVPSQGSIFMGEKGSMLLPHVGGPQFSDRALLEGIDKPKLSGLNHWHSFLDAVKGGPMPSASFDYSGPMTESILAGGIATRFPNETLNWDAKNLKFTNKDDANQFVKREYRKGW